MTDQHYETPPGERDGRSPVERLALARLRTDVAAMPASDVVQLVLWPQTVADWARSAHVAPAVAYNLLSRFKPYRRVRELLAHRLDVPVIVLDHLVDAARPLPASYRSPARPLGDAASPPAPPPQPSGQPRLAALRDGGNPLEQRAVFQAWRDVAALPASILVQLALFPESLADWARRRKVPPSMLYAMLAGTHRHPRVREALARQLDVSTLALDGLVDATRREPAAPPSLPLADSPPVKELIVPDEAHAHEVPSPAGRRDQPPDLAQLSLGLRDESVESGSRAPPMCSPRPGDIR